MIYSGQLVRLSKDVEQQVMFDEQSHYWFTVPSGTVLRIASIDVPNYIWLALPGGDYEFSIDEIEGIPFSDN